MKNNFHNAIEIEKSLLGLILINPKIVNKIRGYIIPDDFFEFKNKLLFTAIIELIDQGYELDIPSLLNHLVKIDILKKIGGEIYLTELIQQAGFETNINKYIKEITDKTQLRKVHLVIKKLANEIEKTDVNADLLLEKVEQDILSTTRSVAQKDFETAKVIVKNSLSVIEKKAAKEGVSGLETDFPSLDLITSGFQKGDLIILAARPSMGKTALALNIAANIAKKHNVALFSLEMPSVSLMNRILSFTGYIEGNKLRDPAKLTSNDWKKLHLAAEKAEKLNLFIDDSAGIKLSEVVWKAKKLAKNMNIDMVVIDYLQLITVKSSSDNRQAEVSIISRTLKHLARELEIPVLALSQLSRKVEQRENKTPMMSDLRESGAIEQDADIIAFLYREAYYDKEKNALSHQNADVIIAKHRNGATGTISLSFNPNIGLFTDIENGNK